MGLYGGQPMVQFKYEYMNNKKKSLQSSISGAFTNVKVAYAMCTIALTYPHRWLLKYELIKSKIE